MSWAWLLVGVAYVIGMTPSAIAVGRLAGVDPVRSGSGNPGASNVYRLAGKRFGLAVLLADVAKGALPVALGLLADGRALGAACWCAAALGHIFPIARRFRGGKGVATTGGGVLVLFPLIGLVLLAVFFLVLRLVKTASIGSMTIAALLPVLVAAWGRPGWEIAVSAAVALLVLVRHESNIRRLLGRSEPTIH